MNPKFDLDNWPKRPPHECPDCKPYSAVILRYDGRLKFIKGENRQWMLLSHFIDINGHDRFGGNFNLSGLVHLGIVKL